MGKRGRRRGGKGEQRRRSVKREWYVFQCPNCLNNKNRKLISAARAAAFSDRVGEAKICPECRETVKYRWVLKPR